MASLYADFTLGDEGNAGTELLPLKYAVGMGSSTSGKTLSAGDSMFHKCGETWRQTTTMAYSGTNDSTRITYTKYGTGALPRILGSTQVSTWSDGGSNQWSAACAADPNSVWFIDGDGNVRWGEEQTSKANCVNEYDWYWDGATTLWVYAASDPDTRYASVEKGTREKGIIINACDYITISYFNICCHAVSTDSGTGISGIFNQGAYAEYPIVEYCHLHHNGLLSADPQGNGFLLKNVNNGIFRYNTAYCNGRRGLCCQSDGPAHTCNNNVIEHNTVYNNFHAGIDNFLGSESTQLDNVTIRYNLAYCDANFGLGWSTELGSHGILVQSDSATYRVTNAKVYYNICLNQHQNAGIHLRGNDGTQILNNTVYGDVLNSSNYGIYVDNVGSPLGNANIVVKNNIAMDRGTSCFDVRTRSYVTSCDNNCWYQSGAAGTIYTKEGSNEYHSNDFAAYKSATGWDTNGKWESPLFVDAANGNFHLQSGSPCRNAGADVSLTEDYDGVSVPQETNPAIGALEYILSTITPDAADLALVGTAPTQGFGIVVPGAIALGD